MPNISIDNTDKGKLICIYMMDINHTKLVYVLKGLVLSSSCVCPP